MRLADDQVRRFYAMWMPLLTFVNRERNLMPDFGTWDESRPLAPEQALILRDALWKDDQLLDSFVARNPAGLVPDDLAILASWKYRLAGTCFVFRHLKKHSLFIKQSRVYAVHGLACPIEEITPRPPCLVPAVLLPFDGRIIFDSLLTAQNISFGGGVRRMLGDTYRQAKMRGEIITSLVPDQAPVAAKR
jgi:hypothetical protein